jgi:hypothetical protein
MKYAHSISISLKKLADVAAYFEAKKKQETQPGVNRKEEEADERK